MYKKFYGFRDMPFFLNGDCDPNSVYLSQNYTKVLPLLISSLDKKVTLTLVLGEDGVGKTTLINHVCNFFPQLFDAKLINSHLDTTQDFFQQVLTSFNQKVSNDSAYEMLLQLSFFFSKKFKDQDGLSTLLIIDNADSMTLDALKGIELLLGLNAEGSQILQIMLVGQPKLESLLNVPDLHNLLQNTTAKYLLEPLSAQETQHYINHKINLAGGQNNILFDQQACSIIYEYSKGIPSIINWISDNSLLRGSELQKNKINSELILEVINEQVGNSEKKNVLSVSSLALITGVLISGISLAFFLTNNFFSTSKNLSEEQLTEIFNTLERHPVSVKSNAQITGLEKASLQAKNPEISTKKEIITQRIQNGISTRTSIERKLATAEQQMANLKYSSPKNDNAYETYMAILQVAPAEKRVIDGLQRIAIYYLDQAKKQRLKGRLDKSQLLISKGLKVSPNHEELTKLQVQISIDVKHAKQQNKINVLFKQAERQINTLQFTKPFNNNAHKTYQDILALDKNNMQAKYGILNILFRLKSRAQNALAEEDYATALEISEEILALPSKGVSDPFHKKVISAAIETKKIVINNLLSLADNQRQAQQLTTPQGDNALESYNKVLQIAPNNKDAKNGLNSLELHFQELTRAALSANNNDQALKLANEGLKAFPNNPALLALHSNAMLKQEVLKKAEDSIANQAPLIKVKN